MKQITAVISLAVALCTPLYGGDTPVVESKAERSEEVFTYFVPHRDYVVKVFSRSAHIASFAVPKGTYLGLTSIQTATEVQPADPTMSLYIGDISIKLRPRNEVSSYESKNLRDIMSRAPISMELKDVAVLVQVVKEEPVDPNPLSESF